MFPRKIARTIALTADLPDRARRQILKDMGAEIDPSAVVYFPCEIKSKRLVLGEESSINRGFFCDTQEVIIGKHVQLGPRVIFATDSHEVGPSSHRAGKPFGLPIVVEDGCWIGAGVIVLPGVTIAKGCVIGAGSLVTKDTEPDGLYLGSPARRVKDLPPPFKGSSDESASQYWSVPR